LRESLKGFGALVGGQSRRPAEFHALGLGTGSAVARTGKDQLALELSQPAQDGQHQAPVCGRGVGPGIAQRLEAGTGLGDGVEDVEEITGGAGQPIEACHHQHVALAEALDDLGQLGAVGLGAADLLGIDLGAARGV
jgi:hypothetical protein